MKLLLQFFRPPFFFSVAPVSTYLVPSSLLYHHLPCSALTVNEIGIWPATLFCFSHPSFPSFPSFFSFLFPLNLLRGEPLFFPGDVFGDASVFFLVFRSRHPVSKTFLFFLLRNDPLFPGDFPLLPVNSLDLSWRLCPTILPFLF